MNYVFIDNVKWLLIHFRYKLFFTIVEHKFIKNFKGKYFQPASATMVEVSVED